MAKCGSCGCCAPCDCDPCGASTGCNVFENKCDELHGYAPRSADENEMLEEGSTPIGPDTRTTSSVGHPGYYAGQHPRYFDYGASNATGGRGVDVSSPRGSVVDAVNGKHADGDDDDESLSDEEIEIEFGRAQDSSSGPRKAHSTLGGRSKKSGNSCCALLCGAWWCQVCCCLIILAIIAAAIATPLILRNREETAAAPIEENTDGNTRDSPQAGGSGSSGVGAGGIVGGGDGSNGAAADADFDLEQYTKDVYDTLLPVSGSNVFDEGSPQNLAAEWILADAANYADGKEGAPVPRDVNDPRFLQRYALGVSHHALGGDEWSMCDSAQDDDEATECTEDGKTTRWLSAGDECNWYGITCNSNGMIAKMDLGDSSGGSGLGLSGEIPQEIGEMTTLRSLDLGNNGNVGGTIPETLSKTSLEQIDLANNQIESPFPKSLYGNKLLQKIDIQNNNLDGPLPDFGAIPNLVYVDASGNDFSGTIPTTVGSLTRLRVIDLGRNELSGPLPDELGQADRLERIIVNHNNLEGTISSDIASLPRLTQLNVRNNMLDGQIPESIGEMGNYWAENGTRRKKTILLDGNELEGDLPETIGSIDGLNTLSLQGNNFKANQFLPQTICDLETFPSDDSFNLEKIFSDCEQVDCRCSDACQCIDGSPIGTVHEIIAQKGPFDYDGDGLIDESAAGTSPFSPDSDGDGASDKEELNAGTNPLDPTDTPSIKDSNKNGVSDEVEAAFLADSDADGLTDEVEVILGLNANSPDSDNDGASDSKEIGAGTNPLINEDLIDEDETGPAFGALAKVSGNAVYVNDSPQNKAAKFVALNDPSGPRDPSNPYFLQRYALATFYYSTEGDQWEECHQNGKDSCDINGSRSAFLSDKHECLWAGVVCHNSGKVATIDFGADGNGLSGDIPPEVGLLDELEQLNIPNNGITSIPEEIGNTQITELNISANKIKAFPSTLEGKDSLKRVYIDHNAFESQSLPDFSSMNHLEVIQASNNGFTGTIDPNLGSLDELRTVDLSHNGLTGKIPTELGQLEKLVRLDLSNNQLTGNLSPEVVSMPRLISLSASDNMISGPIPSEIESMGSYWSEKDLQRNKAIRLDGNVLEGPIPEEIAAIKDLKDLALHGAGNKFSGEIPQAVCDMSLDELSSYCAILDCSCSDACVCVDDVSIHNMIDNDAVSLDSAIIGGDKETVADDGSDATDDALSLDSSAITGGIAVVEGDDQDSDSDGDGLSDEAEEKLGLNPYNPDSDGDGASDKEELNAGTDPKDPQSKPEGLADANNDGISDSLTTALLKDSDGDGLTDSVEAEDGTDPFSVDSDLDGATDSEEKRAGTDPLNPTDTPAFVKKEKNDMSGAVLDTNKDGQSDAVEAAKARDTDGDGIVDFVEAYDGTDPTAKDTDLDSFSDSEEKNAGSNPNDPLSTPLSIEKGAGDKSEVDSDPSALEEGNPSVYKVLKSISGDSIESYGSPQYTAARWIISSDPAGTRAGDDPRLVQRYVLATFYFATNKDNNWKRCYEDHKFCNPGEAFLSEADECEWSGVTCDDETRMITRLEMQSNSLQGFMPSELGSLNSLLLLDLSQNEIGLTIPSSLSETPLIELILSDNELVGPFPESLYDKETIEHVCIDRNNYEGAMPTWANMPSLRHIYAFDNNFVGTLDPAIGTLTELRTIAFNNNKLEGTIPPTFTALKNLEVFEVANNNLEGEIPEGILGLPRLRYLWLASNSFSGVLSGSIGDMGSAWASEGTARGKYIRLEDNQFSGSIPSELGSIKDLYLLTLHDNSFQGEMPQTVCDLPVAGASVDQYGLFKLTSSCEEVDCSCSSVCKCIDGGDGEDWQLQGRRT